MSLKVVSITFKYWVMEDLPKDSHSRAHQAFATLAICGNKVEELEDRLNIRLKSSNLRSTLVGQEDTAPSIHDTFAEGDHILHGISIDIIGECDARRLLKDLCYNRQVGLEVYANSLCDISESDENGGFECISKTAVCLYKS